MHTKFSYTIMHICIQYVLIKFIARTGFSIFDFKIVKLCNFCLFELVGISYNEIILEISGDNHPIMNKTLNMLVIKVLTFNTICESSSQHRTPP